MKTQNCGMRVILICLCLFMFLAVSDAQSKKDKPKPKVEARLIVEDRGDLFSPEAITKAKAILAEVKDVNPREMSLVSFKELPEAKKKQFEKVESADDRKRFFSDWAKEEARDDKAKGIFVLICRKPGHVEILVDRPLRDKGFSARDEEQVVKMLIEKFKEAKDKQDNEQTTIRDKGLINAAEFVRDAYKKMAR
jgi:hypothetical protein